MSLSTFSQSSPERSISADLYNTRITHHTLQQLMFGLIYSAFFVVLALEVVIFLFLTLPTPRGWKGKVVGFLNTSKSVDTLKRLHMGFCIIALIFLYQAYNSQGKFRQEKHHAKEGDSFAAELKHTYYSYMTLKAQRNTYICLMLVVVSIALNAYVAILNFMYRKREVHEKAVLLKEKEEAVKPEKKSEEAETPGANPYATESQVKAEVGEKAKAQ